MIHLARNRVGNKSGLSIAYTLTPPVRIVGLRMEKRSTLVSEGAGKRWDGRISAEEAVGVQVRMASKDAELQQLPFSYQQCRKGGGGLPHPKRAAALA